MANNNSKSSAGEETKKTTPAPAKNEKKEEIGGGLAAVIVALVALIVIAGSIGAFFLFVKLKKSYYDPLTQSPMAVSPGTGGILTGTGGTSPAPAETLPLGTGDTVPVPPIVPTTPTTPTTPTAPTVPTEPTTPETPEVPEVPEPEKVGSYDFAGAIAEMDGSMNSATDTSFNNTFYSNDYFGF